MTPECPRLDPNYTNAELDELVRQERLSDIRREQRYLPDYLPPERQPRDPSPWTYGDWSR